MVNKYDQIFPKIFKSLVFELTLHPVTIVIYLIIILKYVKLIKDFNIKHA